MRNQKQASQAAIIGSAATIVLYAAATATGAPEWVRWTLVALMVPSAALATILIIDRVRSRG